MPETLKIIVSVLCILVLIYLAVSIYGIYSQNSKLEQAKKHLEQISALMGEMKDGESRDYFLNSPPGFILIGWPLKDSSKQEYYPDKCSKKEGDSCLCLCSYYREDVSSSVERFLKINPQTSSVINLVESIRLNSILLNNCNQQSICRDIKAKQIAVDDQEEISKIDLAKLTGESKIERLYSLRVDDLLRDGQYLHIELKDGEYHISPKLKS